ncbi:MAG: response regulator [Desulfatitalea sp.]|nr:response regulator [Desulfatitalea sp.]NNK01159.1 response regulator [Desulfatitalea sp.]
MKIDSCEEVSSPSVLIVDDEDRIRHVCSKMLGQEGYETAQAENAEKGLAMIAQRHFDIILLDLLMPGMSGIEALGRIRMLHPDTVVIVITGYATLDHAVDAMKCGAFDFISKPFSPQDLRLVVTKAIEYIRSLQDIANEKSRIRTMINHLPGGVMAIDTCKQVAMANHAFLNMMGYRGQGPIGKPLQALVSDERILSLIDEALEMPAERFSESTEQITLEAQGAVDERILSARCVPFRDRLGRNLGAITVLHDITTQKKMEQMKSDFVAMVSHEIRGPLNSVLMQQKVVLDGLAGEITEKQHDILLRASEKIKALVDLSGELLDLTKMESGLINMKKQAMKLTGILTAQIAFYQSMAQSKSIDLVLAPLPDLPPVLANPMNMEEVVANLISNAIRYTPEQGRVTVSAAMAGEYVCFKVVDTGLGISPEDQKKIFKRFYRVKNEKTRYIIGTGLGLPIVKNILDAHNGRIEVESREDEGSTFSVYIPVA